MTDDDIARGAAGASAPDSVSVSVSDEERLAQLGYTQVLARRMSAFSNYAVSFTIISVLSGCMTLYLFGMNTGGPAVITWGWVAVGLMTHFVGLAMAEICSAYPTSAGLYFWAHRLAPERSAAAWAWFTGWFNVLGQVAVTAGIDFGAASFLAAYLNLEFGFEVTPGRTILLFAAILLLHGLLNTFGVRIVGLLNSISVWWHVVGVVVIVGALVVVPDSHQSASFVFTEFVNNTGWGSGLYVVLLGLLMAQYTFTGYDASAHMTEETHDASTAAPRASSSPSGRPGWRASSSSSASPSPSSPTRVLSPRRPGCRPRRSCWTRSARPAANCSSSSSSARSSSAVWPPSPPTAA